MEVPSIKHSSSAYNHFGQRAINWPATPAEIDFDPPKIITNGNVLCLAAHVDSISSDSLLECVNLLTQIGIGVGTPAPVNIRVHQF